jgi:hypothetical protein
METSKKMKFHTYNLKNVATLTIAEPVPSQFVWLYLYVEPPLRNGAISSELARFALYKLHGTHHIHWLKGLKTFQLLAEELKWESLGNSPLIQNCNYSCAANIYTRSSLFPLLNESVRHKMTQKKPTCFRSIDRREEKKVLSLLKASFAKNLIPAVTITNIGTELRQKTPGHAKAVVTGTAGISI